MAERGRWGARKSSTVLITGIAGFVGSHLADFLLSQETDLALHGLARTTVVADCPNLVHLAHESRLTLHTVDMRDAAALKQLLVELQPQWIFHLAARSHVAPSFADPATTLVNNLTVSLNLFEAVRAAGLSESCRILNAGSSDQYGIIEPADLPVRETQSFRPTNPYAVSKISQEMLGYQYYQAYGLQIINTRAFNHLGPRQNPNLALSAFARQIAQAESYLIEPIIKVGNLDATRDYTDVRDIVRGYWLALEKLSCLPGQPYNLCSGQDWQMSALLDMMLTQADISLEVQTDSTKMRPADIKAIRGDATLFYRATGWQPTIPLHQSLHDLLDFWRKTVRD